tara:strand:+ start:2373 stop:4001 length:1629 start_codon:yes stop_codon:yes gene_type:complete
MNSKIIFLLLIAIGLVSFSIKLYHIDFSLPPTSDDSYGYILRSFSILNNDFTEPIRKTLGWPIILSGLYNLIDSNNFLDYVNAGRLLSMIISTLTIFPMYLFARKFFNEKFSILASLMFAFEPHLLYNSASALSEPIFILLTISSCYFVLEKKFNYSYIFAFLICGLAVWMRFNGLITLIILSIVFFVTYKPTPKNLLKYSGCLLIFFIILTPMLVQKNEQYGNPFYFSQTNQLFSGNYADILSDNSRDLVYSYSNFIEDYGFNEFVQRFLFTGTFNLLESIVKLAFPYLIVFLPFGIILSFRHSSIPKSKIASLWIMLLGSISIFVIYFSIIPDKRLIYHILPFLIIFSTIIIQKIVQNGTSTFSFSQKQKNLTIFCFIIFIVITSCLFTIRYDSSSDLMYREKFLFTEHIATEFDGKILDGGNTLEFLKFVTFNSPTKDFKSYQTQYQDEIFKNPERLNEIALSATSLKDLIRIGEDYQLEYIAVSKDNVDQLYPFLFDVYANEKNNPFLEKVFDTTTINNQKFHAKVFKINYEKFFDTP